MPDRFARMVPHVAVVAYLWLVLAWFDHDLRFFLAEVPAGVPAILFLGVMAWLVWKRGWPSLVRDRDDRRALVGVVGLAAVSRLPFLFGAYGLFSSDASTLGIMALHIMEGKHHPIFLYRWSYIGSLKAHLTAALGVLTGEPVVSFLLAAIVVYAGFVGAVFLLARTVLPRTESILAALYAILAPGFLTAWGMHNEGNYLDVLFLGTGVLVIGARLLAGRDTESRPDVNRVSAAAFWMGVLCGLAFWAHILATYYWLAAVGILVAMDWSRKIPSRLGWFGAGFVVGDFPGILWNASHEWLSFRWWALDATQAAEGGRLQRVVTQLEGVVASSLSVLSGWWPVDAPPWPGAVWRWILLPWIPAVVLLFLWQRRQAIGPVLRGKVGPESLLLGFFLLVIALFVQSSFGWMVEEPRYLLFVFSVVPIFVAHALGWLYRRARALALVVGAVLLYVNLSGTLSYLGRAVASDAVNREFLRDVESLGVRYAHTDYHISYKYNFLSHGRLVWTSELGPAQTEWYLPYREEVAAADEVALVPRSFRFARRLGRRLDRMNVAYRREDLLYPILFDFSERIRPEDLR